MRQIEVIRCWDDSTWDTDFVEIDYNPDMSDSELRAAAEAAVFEALSGSADLPVFIGIYNIPEDVEEDDI
jgi:hypothetical protein